MLSILFESFILENAEKSNLTNIYIYNVFLFNAIHFIRAQSPVGNGIGLPNDGSRKNVGEHAFDDLLGTQGFANFGKKETGPRTMAEMKRVEMAKEMDPDRLLVCYWI